MTTRELFESRFPVPDGVYFDIAENSYLTATGGEFDVAIYHNAKWIGFQAGYAAAKEGK